MNLLMNSDENFSAGSKNLLRKVFYISGYDPRGAGFYHGLYDRESKKQSNISGYEINVGSRNKVSKTQDRWRLSYICESGEKAETEYNFLKWDDIVRKFWIRDNLTILKESLKTYYTYLTQSNTSKAFKDNNNLILSFYYPLVYFAVLIFLSIIFAGFISSFFSGAFGSLMFSIFFVTGLIAGYKAAEKFKIYWMLQILNFCKNPERMEIKEVDERINIFAQEILKELQKDNNKEVIVASHSIGVFLLIKLMSKLADSLDDKQLGMIKFLILGQPAPLMSYFKESNSIHEDLQKIQKRNFFIVDVASPADAACFALQGIFEGVCDEGASKLVLISPKFHLMFNRLRYKIVKLNKYRMHFQYLMAAEESCDYDYFKITAGAGYLEDNIKSLVKNESMPV